MKNEYGVLIKSDRALEAEANGAVTFSRLSAWQKRAVECGAVHSFEWHHTGGAANRTYYYYPSQFEKLNPADFPPEKVNKVAQPDLKRLRIEIEYEKMVSGFSRRAKKKFETVVVEGLDVRKSDGVIIGAGGRRLNSNNTYVQYSYLPPRCRKWRTVTREEVEALGYKLLERY